MGMTPRALPCACGCGLTIAPDHVGARVSGISEEDLEEIAGNSESDPSDDSSMP